MKIAIISDIHGNLMALVKVLNDIKTNGVDEIVCLGDIATLGPDPVEVVEIMENLNCQFIMGNHDEFINNPDLIKNYIKVPQAVAGIEWTINRLSGSQKNFIEGFKNKLEVNLNSGEKLLFYHGSPRSNCDEVLAETAQEELDNMFVLKNYRLMAGGHTHIQMYRKFKGNIIINPGSVGYPFKEYVGGQFPSVQPYAEYCLVEVRGGNLIVIFKQLELDKKALLERAMSADESICEMLVQLYK